jgi:hypothetical protein
VCVWVGVGVGEEVVRLSRRMDEHECTNSTRELRGVSSVCVCVCGVCVVCVCGVSCVCMWRVQSTYHNSQCLRRRSRRRLRRRPHLLESGGAPGAPLTA